MGKKEKILVVDDEEQNVKLLKTILIAEGYDVESAANGQEAVEKSRSYLPDLILLDILMPIMNGFEASRQILELRHFGESILHQLVVTQGLLIYSEP